MMDDRTLLERAAKAAGLQLDYTIRPDGKAFYHSDRNALALADGGWFAPLNDDGDALRLAVKLNIFSGPEFYHLRALERFSGQDTDDLTATRRAIVRAAAEIGGE